MTNAAEQPTRRLEAVILDVETTDNKEPHLIEAAYGYIDNLGAIKEETLIEQRFNPGVPSTLGALATHHILDEDLVGKPHPNTFTLPEDIGFIVGHNVQFDLKVLGLWERIPSIDTMLLSQRAFSGLDSYKQVTLFYHLSRERGLDMHAARDLALRAHGAGADIKMCSVILQSLVSWSERYVPKLRRIVDVAPDDVFNRLAILTQAAQFPLVMTFGKHQGERPWEINPSYRSWYAKQESPDPYLLMAMHKGTSEETEQGKLMYKLAHEIYETPDETPNEVEMPLQQGFAEDVDPPVTQARFSFKHR